MARGRMLNTTICTDKAVHALSSDTCRLAFSWTIPHLDRDGRVRGDPVLLKALIFPRRDDVSTEDMAGYIQEWHDGGLCVLYEAEGEQFLWFPNFQKNQIGLRYNREPASILPEPPGNLPEVIRQTSGTMSAEEKRKEEKRTHERPPTATIPADAKSVFTTLINDHNKRAREANGRTISNTTAWQSYAMWVRKYGQELVEEVVSDCLTSNSTAPLGWITKVLRERAAEQADAPKKPKNPFGFLDDERTPGFAQVEHPDYGMIFAPLDECIRVSKDPYYREEKARQEAAA